MSQRRDEIQRRKEYPMSLEQLEGQMQEYEGKTIAVAIPIRGTVFNTFYGELTINHDWANHAIYYSIRLHPDQDINFQAQDIQKITEKPNENLEASVQLKGDEERYAFNPP